MREGGLDWSSVQVKNQADHIATNKGLVRLLPHLSKSQRMEACRRLSSGPKSGELSLLQEIIEAMVQDYGEAEARARDRCHCGGPASRLVQFDWAFVKHKRSEYKRWYAFFLLVGLIVWKRKMVSFEFSTYHAACPTCANTAFGSKSAFEKAIESVPDDFRGKRGPVYPFVPILASVPVAAVATNDLSEAPLYYLVGSDREKGPFSIDQLKQLIEASRLDASSRLRSEGSSDLVSVASILGK